MASSGSLWSRKGCPMAKRIVVCSDGTWSTPDQRATTNVVKMSLAITPSDPTGKSQVVFYDQGVGTGNFLDRLTGGAFGGGLYQNIEDAYRFLMNNYDDGDEIFLFGFSRGAYTVRSTAGLVRKTGVLQKLHANKFPDAYRLYRSRDVGPDAENVQRFREQYSRTVEINFLGVWDTVGALGLPVRGLRFLTRRRYEFHDVELSRIVKSAYHAVAIDERRAPFTPSLWTSKQKEGQTIEQVWFVGVHSDVGGGCPDAQLSDITFMWMKGKAQRCGLAFDEEFVNTFIHPDESGVLHNSKIGLYRLTPGITRAIGEPAYANQAIHCTAVDRLANDASYKPANLISYIARADHRVAARSKPT